MLVNHKTRLWISVFLKAKFQFYFFKLLCLSVIYFWEKSSHKISCGHIVLALKVWLKPLYLYLGSRCFATVMNKMDVFVAIRPFLSHLLEHKTWSGYENWECHISYFSLHITQTSFKWPILDPYTKPKEDT